MIITHCIQDLKNYMNIHFKFQIVTLDTLVLVVKNYVNVKILQRFVHLLMGLVSLAAKVNTEALTAVFLYVSIQILLFIIKDLHIWH